MIDYKHARKLIALYGIDNGISYQDIADNAGVARSTLYRFMSKRANGSLSLESFTRIASLLKCSLDTLIGFDANAQVNRTVLESAGMGPGNPLEEK